MLDIKINEFEGPLDLLLHLVETKKMDILSIRISDLIDDYLEIINQNEKDDKFKLKVEFLQMASVLLEIKAFSILRKDKKNNKEVDLEKRLVEYKLIKEFSEMFSKNENEYYRSYKKYGNKDFSVDIIEHDNDNLTLDSLKEAIDNLIKKLNIREDNKLILNLEEKFSVEDALVEIDEFKENKFSFSQLLKAKYTKERIVSFFMAILEAYKENKIDIEITEEEFYIIKGQCNV
ncbi:segregation and condensation protein A [Oceanivirga miroungae]|uniref:Segregation and condensation protein A n=1 Tax=Oceanivirga miroungae TaxID=1130046 RepID=A0A6I8M6F4_9FUSO|nr:ScpA family protein [Oceanivirga miroungae]VWL85470.1 chromosome segregation and condensation protein ScpA [Oceanivirga miroungae]